MQYFSGTQGDKIFLKMKQTCGPISLDAFFVIFSDSFAPNICSS